MRYPAIFSCGIVFILATNATAQLPVQISLEFDDPAEFQFTDWMFVAPTPLGVTRADPEQTVSVAGGRWNWSIAEPNEVLVGVHPEFELTDMAIETDLVFSGIEGTSVGFLNRFGTVPNPDDPNSRLAHGYCTLVSPETITLIDFDFAREPDDYIRALAQVPTPNGLLDDSQTTAVFQTIDGPSSTDPNNVVPRFGFWLGGQHIFDGIEDPNASWASGYGGVDVWTVDPFAQLTASAFTVNFDSLEIRGVPEPSTFVHCGMALVILQCVRRRRRWRS